MQTIVIVGFVVIFLLLFGLLTFAFIDAVSALKNVANALSKLSDGRAVKKKDYVELDGVIYELLGFYDNLRPIVRPCADIKLLPAEERIRSIKL